MTFSHPDELQGGGRKGVGVWMTVADLDLWEQNFYNPKAGSEQPISQGRNNHPIISQSLGRKM